MSDFAPAVAPATLDLYNALGPIPSYGVGDQALGYPLMRFLDGIGQILQRLNDLALDDPATGDPGWSVLFDVDRCPTYALPWLAQACGVVFSPADTTDAAQRAAIKAEPAMKRGSVGAIQAAAAKYLNPGEQAVIYERDTGPYHFSVVISLTQLVRGSYAQVSAQYATYTAMDAAFGTYNAPVYPQAAVEAALQAAKPAGLTMTINVVTGPTYSEVDGAFATYSALEAALPVYADIPAWS